MLFVFSWIVFVVVVACTIAVFLFLAMLPGMIAKKRRHPWQQAVTTAGWLARFFGFALWPLALVWAYVDAPAPRARGDVP